jgi:hypothetical protein
MSLQRLSRAAVASLWNEIGPTARIYGPDNCPEDPKPASKGVGGQLGAHHNRNADAAHNPAMPRF